MSTNVDQSICYAVEGNTVDRDSKKNGCGYCEGVSPTLNTQDRHAVTYAIEGNGTRESHKGDGYRESDKMYTLNTTEQHAVAYGIDQQGGKGNASYQVDVMPTLCSDSHGTPHAVCFQQNQREEVRDMGEKTGAVTAEPGMHNTNYLCQRNGQPEVVCAMASSCVNAEITDGSISPTLMARAGTGGNQLPLLCLNDQGGSVMDVSDKAGCLRAQEHGHQPVVCFEPGIAKRDGSDGRFVEGKSVTLRANAGDNKPAVCFQASGDRANPSISVSENAYCLPANPMSDRGQAVAFPCEAVGHDMRSTNFGKDGKVDPLTATDWKEPPFVCYGVDCRNGCLDKEKTHTIQAKSNGGISVNCTPSVCYSVENHSNDSRVTIRDDDKCQTLTSRMGTGGNNVPMVLEIRDE